MLDVKEELLKRTVKSKEIFEGGAEVLAAEVVSTVAMPQPIYVAEAKGSKIVDVDGNEYIDLTMGFGPHVLGHAPDFVIDAVREVLPNGFQVGIHNPRQEPLARLMVDAAPGMEQVVFANSGTEATLFGIRAARAYTGKPKIGMFDGGYHGAHDVVLAIANKKSPREAPVPYARGSGIPEETTNQIIMLPYREEAAFDLIRQHKDELAVVLLEPVQSSNPRLDTKAWMQQLREVCRECDVLFLMDEVITGFRLTYGGGQQFFDVQPDLATYGKIMGGGMPVGALSGPREIMRVFMMDREAQRRAGFDVIRPIFYGGTFSGNPMTMVAGGAIVRYLKEHRSEVYPYLDQQGNRFASEVNDFCQAENIPAQLMNADSMFHLHFTKKPIESSRDIDESFAKVENEFYIHLLYHGVIVPGVHLAFISTAHTKADVDQVIEAFKQSFIDIRERGLI
jgi:glutamate-1-semialdehyde-2,1-aminomutase